VGAAQLVSCIRRHTQAVLAVPVVLNRRSAGSSRRFTNRSSKDLIAPFDPVSLVGDPVAAAGLLSFATRR
jgi:hypothetical protein